MSDDPTVKKNWLSVVYPNIDKYRQESFELVEGIRLSDQTTDLKVEMSCVEILDKLDEMETLYYDIAKIMNTIPGLYVNDGEENEWKHFRKGRLGAPFFMQLWAVFFLFFFIFFLGGWAHKPQARNNLWPFFSSINI